MFEKTLTDLVRGLRANRKNEGKYLSQCIQEIKEELKSTDEGVKAQAIQKLTYMQQFGYEMSWAAFNVVEVMSHVKFSHKRIGYLAATQSFNESTEVVLLITNQFKKDFSSKNQYEVGLALNCLANICTEDLARDLVSDVVAMLNSARPLIRKKAVLVLYKIILRIPEALRPAFPRLKEKLDDPEPSVQCAAVNVICELARRNPKNYLSLASLFFKKLLAQGGNNWMLIKIVKLFGALCPLEPRLAKKLIDPLTNLISSTTAMSLMFECINTATIGIHQHVPLMKLCMEKLKLFVDDPDQNLKYLGLVGMKNIMKVHPKLVLEHKQLIIQCLDDEDATIRLQALELVTGMVNKRNLQDLVSKLLDHVENCEDMGMADDIIAKIIDICCQGGTYKYVTNFQWYIAVLCDLATGAVLPTKHGRVIATQLLDIAMRVRVVRPFAVENMVKLLSVPRLSDPKKSKDDTVNEVLYAAAWIVGEWCTPQHIASEKLPQVVEWLLMPRAAQLPPAIQAVFVQSVLKIFSHMCGALSSTAKDEEMPQASIPDEVAVDPQRARTFSARLVELRETTELILGRLPMFAQSTHLEVQERAVTVLELVRMADQEIRKPAGEIATGRGPAAWVAGGSIGLAFLSAMASVFQEEIKPVSDKAQRKVQVPANLDLDAWIHEPPAEGDEIPDSDVESDSGEGKWPEDSSREVTAYESFGSDDDSPRAHPRKGHRHRRHRHSSGSEPGDVHFLGESAKTEQELKEQRAAREAERARAHKGDPFYLTGSSPAAVSPDGTEHAEKRRARHRKHHDRTGPEEERAEVLTQLVGGFLGTGVDGDEFPKRSKQKEHPREPRGSARGLIVGDDATSYPMVRLRESDLVLRESRDSPKQRGRRDRRRKGNAVEEPVELAQVEDVDSVDEQEPSRADPEAKDERDALDVGDISKALSATETLPQVKAYAQPIARAEETSVEPAEQQGEQGKSDRRKKPGHGRRHRHKHRKHEQKSSNYPAEKNGDTKADPRALLELPNDQSSSSASAPTDVFAALNMHEFDPLHAAHHTSPPTAAEPQEQKAEGKSEGEAHRHRSKHHKHKRRHHKSQHH